MNGLNRLNRLRVKAKRLNAAECRNMEDKVFGPQRDIDKAGFRVRLVLYRHSGEGRNPGNMREQENLRIPDRVRDDDDEDFIDDPLKV